MNAPIPVKVHVTTVFGLEYDAVALFDPDVNAVVFPPDGVVLAPGTRVTITLPLTTPPAG